MGQQQLLLIVLGVIIVGVAIVAGINIFRASAITSKRDNVLNECINLAAMAQQYYMKPTSLGGGGKSFINWTVPAELQITANGNYKAVVYSDSIIITGTGNEVVTANDSVQVEVTVLPTSFRTKIIH
ncbi:hypothetical protein ABRY23_12010 [Melioribacteraceae bacterium 4301-Me]|uniref:hypothetical protein n=1 Tax=Pyranulibacter aquaticus TaxID=3163344 RepID=UPI0035967116